MPRINFPTIGDIEDYEFLQGTIRTIDSSTDTCTVEVDGSIIPALLFYHCLPDSQLRENGAIEGSAAGFSEGDSVIVQLKYDRSLARVVAHVDGVRSCGSFSLKLYRDDDIVHPLGELRNDFSLYINDEEWNQIVCIGDWDEESYYKRNADGSRLKDAEGNDVPVYNSATKRWEFDSYIWDESNPTHPVIPPKGETPAQYWYRGQYNEASTNLMIYCSCEDSPGAYYRNLSAADKALGKWPRMIDWSTYWAYPASEKFVKATDIVFPLPYFKATIGSYVGVSWDAVWSGYPMVQGSSLSVTSSVESSLPWKASYGVSGRGTVFWYLNPESPNGWPDGRGSLHAQSSDGVIGQTLGVYDTGYDTVNVASAWQNSKESGDITLSIGSPGPAVNDWQTYYHEPDGVTHTIMPFLRLIFRGYLGVSFSYDDTYEYCIWNPGQAPPK